MQTACSVLLAVLLCGAVSARPAHAQDELPYSYYRLEEKITVTAHDAHKSTLTIPGGVQVLDYREVEYYARTAMVTLSARQPVVVAALVYTKPAVYVINPGLLLPGDHVTTLSALLPDTTSLLRLLVFDRMPSSSMLASFAARPSTSMSQYLLGDLWLRTYVDTALQPGAQFPWEERFDYIPRPAEVRTRWPYAFARLDSGSYVHAKNCSVKYNGLPTVEIGAHGTAGSWPLEIAESLRVSFYIPPRLSYRRAVLVLRSLPSGVQYDLRLNGFLVPTFPDENGAPVSPGPDLRNYLRSGVNELELRAPNIGQGGRLTQLELWLD